jgi:hypothetical protein
MTLMRVFFRLVDEAYERAERLMRPATPGEIDGLMAMANELQSEIEATPAEDVFKELATWFGWPNAHDSTNVNRSEGSA